jgi:hypothetical protein
MTIWLLNELLYQASQKEDLRSTIICASIEHITQTQKEIIKRRYIPQIHYRRKRENRRKIQYAKRNISLQEIKDGL